MRSPHPRTGLAILLLGVVGLTVFSVWAARASQPARPPDAPGRVILLSVDGAGDWMLDRFLERGMAPAFETILRQGASAEALLSSMPTLTAPAHATFWTGATPRVHGIVANNVSRLPRAEHTLMDARSGFDSRPLRAEPIWTTAAKAGRRVLVLQATVGYPFTPEHADHLLQFDVYGNRLLLPGETSGRLVDGRQQLTLGAETFDLSEAEGGTLLLQARGRQLTLRPGREGAFTEALPIRVGEREGLVRLRLMSYEQATGAFRIWHGLAAQITSNRPEAVRPFVEAAGMIAGEEIVDSYRNGRFGATMAEGGSGDAEWWLEHLLLTNHEYFVRSLDVAGREPWDLLVAYLSSFDSAAHAFAGMLDPASGRYTAERAERAWPRLERLFELTVDRYVADLRRRFPDATLVIVSDHGMAGADSLVLPNVALRQAGLLALTPGGEIDLGRTQVLFMQSRGQMVFVNSSDWKNGVVPPGERERVKREATAALLRIRHPKTGAPAIRAVFDPDIDGDALGIGGETGGDLYFDPQPGYYTAGSARGDSMVIEGPPTGYGFHGSAPWRRTLHAIFYAVGPGVASGRRLGLVRAIDVAPTVAALLGIPPPPSAEGLALRLQ